MRLSQLFRGEGVAVNFYLSATKSRKQFFPIVFSPLSEVRPRMFNCRRQRGSEQIHRRQYTCLAAKLHNSNARARSNIRRNLCSQLPPKQLAAKQYGVRLRRTLNHGGRESSLLRRCHAVFLV